MLKKYLSIKEAAELSSLSKWYLRVGRRRLIPADAFIAWLDKHQDNSKGDGDE